MLMECVAFVLIQRGGQQTGAASQCSLWKLECIIAARSRAFAQNLSEQRDYL
jgi:hypothetical protein